MIDRGEAKLRETIKPRRLIRPGYSLPLPIDSSSLEEEKQNIDYLTKGYKPDSETHGKIYTDIDALNILLSSSSLQIIDTDTMFSPKKNAKSNNDSSLKGTRKIDFIQWVAFIAGLIAFAIGLYGQIVRH